jgi:hypothetical protein
VCVVKVPLLSQFASFGTPETDQDQCSEWKQGGCHSDRTIDVVKAQCMQKSKCALAVSHRTFENDPCDGQGKRLAIRVHCTKTAPASTLPPAAPAGAVTSIQLAYPPATDPAAAIASPLRAMLASGDALVSGHMPPLQCIEPPFVLRAEQRSGGTISPFDLSLKPTRAIPNKIWDMFMFNGEFGLLEIRLEELWHVVDYFVIMEAPTTQVCKV